uniref:hypothetical protein n=1 Tax=Okeania sp. SIO2F4 TaxID=2607790 RepID=UPI0025E426D9|nr:hypothetical protein [Okeania sp. SIO2F4]
MAACPAMVQPMALPIAPKPTVEYNPNHPNRITNSSITMLRYYFAGVAQSGMMKSESRYF